MNVGTERGQGDAGMGRVRRGDSDSCLTFVTPGLLAFDQQRSNANSPKKISGGEFQLQPGQFRGGRISKLPPSLAPSPLRNMASKATKTVLDRPLKMAERLLWEKYNKPNRNLFQALSAFEGYGVGRKVVAHPFAVSMQF